MKSSAIKGETNLSKILEDHPALVDEFAKALHVAYCVVGESMFTDMLGRQARIVKTPSSFNSQVLITFDEFPEILKEKIRSISGEKK